MNNGLPSRDWRNGCAANEVLQDPGLGNVGHEEFHPAVDASVVVEQRAVRIEGASLYEGLQAHHQLSRCEGGVGIWSASYEDLRGEASLVESSHQQSSQVR